MMLMPILIGLVVALAVLTIYQIARRRRRRRRGLWP
jgi:hypothetical protein